MTIVEQLNAANTELATVGASLAEALCANQEFETANAKLAEQVDQLTTTSADQVEKIASLTSQVETLTSQSEELAKINAEQAKALAAPEYVQASTGGKPVPDGGQGDPQESLFSQYSKIKDPKARAAFWRANKSEIGNQSNN